MKKNKIQIHACTSRKITGYVRVCSFIKLLQESLKYTVMYLKMFPLNNM